MALTLQWIGFSILIATFAFTLVRVIPYNGVIDLFWDGVGYTCLLVGNLLEATPLGYGLAVLWMLLLAFWGVRVHRAWTVWRMKRLLENVLHTLLTTHLAAGGTEETFPAVVEREINGKDFAVVDGKLVEKEPEAK